MSLTETDKLRARVATLDKLLDDFDGQLDDLFAKSLPETLLGLDTLQQAKLQVTIPYLVYDLVIIYLKTKGIDPRTHPVFRELERVKGYIEKVSKVEKQESGQQRMAVDKVAANRFIKQAIAQAVRAKDQPSRTTDQGSTPGPSRIQVQPIPAGAMGKMLARAEWETQAQEDVEEEEEDLEVFYEAGDGANTYADVEMTGDETLASTPLPVGKGKTDILSEQHSATTKKQEKRLQRVKLPFTGGGSTSLNNPRTIPSQLEVHTAANPTPGNTSSTKANNKKRPFPPSETPELTTISAPKNKKQKQNKKNLTTTGTETDVITSQSQSQSQSRDVSVASTSRVATLPLPGVEKDVAALEKPKKWRKYNQKKRGAAVRPAPEEAGT